VISGFALRIVETGYWNVHLIPKLHSLQEEQ
jgi:hypothetical protein